MVSALVSKSSGPGSSYGWGHCDVFLGKMLNSHSASLCSGVYMGTSKLNAGSNPVMDQHLIQGRVQTILVASCYRNMRFTIPYLPMGQENGKLLVWLQYLQRSQRFLLNLLQPFTGVLQEKKWDAMKGLTSVIKCVLFVVCCCCISKSQY